MKEQPTPALLTRAQLFLKEEELSDATISRRVVVARQIFGVAKKWKLIPENPFVDVKSGSQKNKARLHFISRDVIQKVIDACPDVQWRLLIALSRFGGLRCPSEHLVLKWTDIDWANERIVVRSPKTEHHEGGEQRVIPLFPELLPYLLKVLAEDPNGSGFVITRYRSSNANLRTQFMRFIRKAGVSPWPRLFQNLRSSRQTELADRFPSHVICAWIGNSEVVARDHYLQVRDEHFTKAVERSSENEAGAHNATQKATQQAAEPRGKVMQAAESPESPDDVTAVSCTPLQNNATPCGSKGLQLVGAEELEHPLKTPGKTGDLPTGGANSGALPSGTHDTDKPNGWDLAAALALIAGLPLSEAEKAQAVRQLLADRGSR